MEKAIKMNIEKASALASMKEINRKELVDELPFRVQGKIFQMRERESAEILVNIILEICTIRPYKLAELGSLLNKGDNYLSRKYLKPLVDRNKLKFQYPDMINHPNQAYVTTGQS
jgi:ATP-dependent DNA helicase RecG